MKTIRSLQILQRHLQPHHQPRKSIGFVPTMGALHDGHLSLIERARKENDVVIVSVYVNPLQFGPGEDYQSYPKSLIKDIGACRKRKVDYVFVPKTKEILTSKYFKNHRTLDYQSVLCAPFRPGHFNGVVSIVACLFRLIAPTRAYFGLKDYQQYKVIDAMTQKKFKGKIQIVPVGTKREKDGLAMSSRNQYLSKQERRQAIALYRALQRGKGMLSAGKVKSVQNVIQEMRKTLLRYPMSRMQYLEVVHAGTLKPVKTIRPSKKDDYLLAGAIHIGKTRLIDNLLV